MKKILFVAVWLGVFFACQQKALVDFAPKPNDHQMAVQSASMVNEQTADWNGTYTAYFNYGEIGGVNAGWTLTIKVAADAIIASGEGYQMFFKDALKANFSKNQLTLTHVKNLEGYKQGKSMNPEFIIVRNNGKYYVKSNWIAAEVTDKATSFGYLIDKKQN